MRTRTFVRQTLALPILILLCTADGAGAQGAQGYTLTSLASSEGALNSSAIQHRPTLNDLGPVAYVAFVRNPSGTFTQKVLVHDGNQTKQRGCEICKLGRQSSS
jgi:hypothetical protein